MPTPDLTLAVARELGYQRTGQRIRTRVERVVRQLLADGVFVKAGDNVSLAERDSA